MLSTLHTVDATETINRIIDFFPPHQQQQARAMIAGTLKGVVSQRLVPAARRQGPRRALEIMVMTGRVRDMILDPKLTGQLPEVITEGDYYGMQTFDQELLAHLQAGRITMEEALNVATSPHDFKLLVARRRPPRHADGRPDVPQRAVEPEHADVPRRRRRRRRPAVAPPRLRRVAVAVRARRGLHQRRARRVGRPSPGPSSRR